MSGSDYPTTDVDEIKQGINQLNVQLQTTNERLDRFAEAVNSIGGNMNWLVQNTQGIFQMFASPQFISQMSNMISGSIANGGQGNDAGTDANAGPDAG